MAARWAAAMHAAVALQQASPGMCTVAPVKFGKR